MEKMENILRQLLIEKIEYNESQCDFSVGTEDLKILIDEAEAKLKNHSYLSHVRLSLDDFPENNPLYKDSGLWQLRSDDMEDVIVQQMVNESTLEFLDRCRYLSEA